MKSDQVLNPPWEEEENPVVRNPFQLLSPVPRGRACLLPPSRASVSSLFFHSIPGQVDILPMPLDLGLDLSLSRAFLPKGEETFLLFPFESISAFWPFVE